MEKISKINKIKNELKNKYEETHSLFEIINSNSISFNNAELLEKKVNEASLAIEIAKNHLRFSMLGDSAQALSTQININEQNINKWEKEYKALNIKTKRNIELAKFKNDYLSWYYATSSCIKFLRPDKYKEFIDLFKDNREKNTSLKSTNYKIENFIKNEELTDISNNLIQEEAKRIKITLNLFHYQQLMIKAIIDNFDSISFNYEKETYMTFQEENIDSVQELFDNDFLRAAGALCGVIIEKHLKTKLLPFDEDAFTSKKLTLEPLNQACKKNNIYTTTEFKRIIHLTDLRNLCDHKNTIGPTKEQVQELIDGTKWIIYSI
ncbi:MAG: hypothetical protein ACPKOI_03525 [Pleomorphochaeta sp.]